MLPVFQEVPCFARNFTRGLRSLCKLSESANQTAFPLEVLAYPAAVGVAAAPAVFEAVAEVEAEPAASEGSGCLDLPAAEAAA